MYSSGHPGFRSVIGRTLGALKVRIGFWGPLYYNYSKESPFLGVLIQDSLVNAGAEGFGNGAD